MAFFNARGFSLPLGKKTYVMGILNATPDSFSDGGLHNSPESALAYALQMQAQGADIIDIGANSTRPGAQLLTEEQELARLEPVLARLRGKLTVPLSVDTFYPACARLALEYGADIINDISGSLTEEPAALCRESGAGFIAVHNPCGAAQCAPYPHTVVAAVKEYFDDCIKSAAELSLPEGRLCLDIGLGFGKSTDDNFELIRRLAELAEPGVPLLVGASRKRFIGAATGIEAPNRRDAGTVAVHTAAIAGGADIIRVHNVPAAVAGARAADMIYRR